MTHTSSKGSRAHRRASGGDGRGKRPPRVGGRGGLGREGRRRGRRSSSTSNPPHSRNEAAGTERRGTGEEFEGRNEAEGG